MWNLWNVPHLSLSSPSPFSPAYVWSLLNINLVDPMTRLLRAHSPSSRVSRNTTEVTLSVYTWASQTLERWTFFKKKKNGDFPSNIYDTHISTISHSHSNLLSLYNGNNLKEAKITVLLPQSTKWKAIESCFCLISHNCSSIFHSCDFIFQNCNFISCCSSLSLNESQVQQFCSFIHLQHISREQWPSVCTER